MDFSPSEPRGWQDEYCEWSIERNAAGKMTTINVTCENPGYYLTMWQQNPQAVLGQYQKYIFPAVRFEDPCLRCIVDQPTGKKGDPVLDPTNGNPASDPANKSNSTPVPIPGKSDGAMHLTSGSNTLSAEIYLAAAATIPRSVAASQTPQTLICCAKYGRNYRNSDPNIGYNANAASYKATDHADRSGGSVGPAAREVLGLERSERLGPDPARPVHYPRGRWLHDPGLHDQRLANCPGRGYSQPDENRPFGKFAGSGGAAFGY